MDDNKNIINAVRGLQKDLDNNSIAIDNYEQAAYKISQGRYSEASELIGKTGNEVAKSTKEAVKDTLKEFNNLSEGAEGTLNKVLGKTYTSTVKLKVDTAEYDKIMKNVTGSMSIGSRASGGWIKSGEVVTVRENGIPEMVGTIGNRAAVANNDQIVDAISIGVAKAMMTTQTSSNVVIEAKGDASGLLDFITFEQKKKDRQYGM